MQRGYNGLTPEMTMANLQEILHYGALKQKVIEEPNSDYLIEISTKSWTSNILAGQN